MNTPIGNTGNRDDSPGFPRTALVCRVRRAPSVSDEQAAANFADFCALLVMYRREQEAKGKRYLDANGNPIPTMGESGTLEDTP